MNFSLRDFLGFVVIICLALALTQVPAVFGFAALIVGFGIAFLILDTTTWRFFLCCALFGIGIYTIAFEIVVKVFAPPETSPAVKAYTEHRMWIESTKPLQHQTSIPVGALLGLTIGIVYRNVRRQINKPITTVHRYWVYAALVISSIGIAGAVEYSIEHFYTNGKLLVFQLKGDTPIRYPSKPENWFAIHLNMRTFAISYPSLIGLGFLAIATVIYALRRRKHLNQFSR